MLHDTLPYITIVIVTTPDNGPRSSGVHARVWRADFEPAAIAALKFLPIGCFRSAHGALPLRAPINVMSICDRPASHEVFHLFQGICVASRCAAVGQSHSAAARGAEQGTLEAFGLQTK